MLRHALHTASRSCVRRAAASSRSCAAVASFAAYGAPFLAAPPAFFAHTVRSRRHATDARPYHSPYATQHAFSDSVGATRSSASSVSSFDWSWRSPLVAAAAVSGANSSTTPVDESGLTADQIAGIKSSFAAPGPATSPQSFFDLPMVDVELNPVIRGLVDSLTWLHDTTGLEWWSTLFVAGLLARLALFPTQLYSARITAGMSGLEPHFMVLDQKTAALPPAERNSMNTRMRVARIKWGMYSKYGCNPYKLLPPILAQVGVFVGMAVAVRSMVRTVPELAHGGTLWFENLALMDPYYVLPVAAVASSYASSFAMEWLRDREAERLRIKAVGALTNGIAQRAQSIADNAAAAAAQKDGVATVAATAASTATETNTAVTATAAPPATTTTPKPPSLLRDLQHWFRGLSILTFPWVVHLPCGIFFFWFAGTLWTHGSAWVLRQSTVRDRLGLTFHEDLLQRLTKERIERETTLRQAYTHKPVVHAKKVPSWMKTKEEREKKQ